MKTIVSLWIIICGYAFSQAQICDPTVTPSNLNSVVSLTNVTLSWDHTPGSAFARVLGTAPTGNSISKFITTTTPGVEPSALTVPLSALSNGEYTWRVVSACNFFPPYMTSAPSEPDTFSVGLVDCGMPIADVEGNVYATVQIGDQCWMAENLATETYRDGTPAEAHPYGEDSANKGTYGLLYKWNAVVDPRGLCPADWHVPTDGEWTELTNHLGGEAIAGGKMKTMDLWTGPNTGATNSSGFSGLPGGSRYSSTFSCCQGIHGWWWSATEFWSNLAWRRRLDYDGSWVGRGTENKDSGFSVRCVRDE